jgi:phosphatidylinositol alpha-1,6-mannosyltransferase
MVEMTPKPRLLIITPDFPPARGGIQVVAHRLAGSLKGFQTRVVAADSPGAGQFDRAGSVAVRRVRADRRLKGARNIPLNAIAFTEALRFRPDVTLSVHIVTSPAAALIHQVLGAPTVQYFHAKEIGAKPRLAAFAANRAQAAIAVSEYTASLIKASGARPPISLISPGVDVPVEITPLPSERPTVLTIARLEDRYKGHDVMLRALPLVRAAVPDVQWTVIGDGPLRSGLERLAAANGIDRSVTFLGSVSDEERNSWLRRADVLAMPSRLPDGDFAGEGFGIVYLEAATFGKPVLAGNVGGALDSVADGESGLLVNPADHVAVADALTRLLLDRELAQQLGATGADRAREFAWPVISSRVEALLLEQIGEAQAR